MTVSVEDVTWSYRLLLGREPESDLVIREHALISDRRELVKVLINSDEFVSRELKNANAGKAHRKLSSYEPGEVFLGYEDDDRERLEALIKHAPKAAEEFFTDCFGQRFHPSYHEPVSRLVGTVSESLPLPNDGHLSEGIEYASAALAFEAARGRTRFSAAELGAGWGPWTTFFGITAQNLGFRRICLAAFEADSGRFAQMRQHLDSNGLVKASAPAEGDDGKLSWKLMKAAAWWKNETVLWPDNLNPADSGMRAETGNIREADDYRGFKVGFKEIPALDIAEALSAMAPLDILHIDIQGSEFELITNMIEFLNTRVHSMFVGTHSRKIEGDLIEFLSGNGWNLLREKPCKMDCGSLAPTLAGKTLIDGAQYWVNPNREEVDAGY